MAMLGAGAGPGRGGFQRGLPPARRISLQKVGEGHLGRQRHPEAGELTATFGELPVALS